jgi:organic radical activating enzyme
MPKQLNEFDWAGDTSARLSNVRVLLNSTGCGFCLAKFRQVSMHLGIGKVHACHIPHVHKLDADQLKQNPNGLFNTAQLKQSRKEMLNGQRPAECSSCWHTEDNTVDGLSARIFKSSDKWSLTDHDSIVQLTGDEDIYPSYLEVSFNNACNLKCIYCSPEFSSKWAEDVKFNGSFDLLASTPENITHQNYGNLETLILKKRDHNPYIDAFWKWLPAANRHLKVFRITGGEPLMSKETFSMLDWFMENPSPHLELSINSNFSVTDKLWDKFIQKVTTLNASGNVKEVKLFTSVEAWGTQAEYIRTGLDFKLLTDRIVESISAGIPVTIMAALNILSLTSYKHLLEWVLLQKTLYNTTSRLLSIDTAYVRGPAFLDPIHASAYLVDYFKTAVDFVNDNTSYNTHTTFEPFEYDTILRVYNSFIDQHNVASLHHRTRFADYIQQLDRRNNTAFLQVFPEYLEFYNNCIQDKNAYMGQHT